MRMFVFSVKSQVKSIFGNDKLNGSKNRSFRATHLNNELSNHFKMNVPLKAHWSYFTCYEDTFTGKEAVNYMLEVVPYMTGSNLTRKQIIVLLQSLMYNKHLIRGNFMFVSVKDENETTFMDDSTIYKLTGDEQVRSPKKSLINSSLLDKLVALCSP